MSKPFNQESIPRLPERRDITEYFCTYLMLTTSNSHSVIQWQKRVHLKRNFELYQKRNQSLLQLCDRHNQFKSVAEFWREIAIDPSPISQDWEPQNRKKLALEHLASYFETDCYHAARAVWLKSKDWPWDEYLCYARIFIYNFDNLLRLLLSYDLSLKTSLDTYIQQTLIKVIQSEAVLGKFSCWRLLAQKSDRELREALQRGGYQEPNISQYIFARKYFKQVYRLHKVNNPGMRKTGKKWPDPEREDFDTAAKCYNAEKSLSIAPHEVSAGSNITGEQIQDWMNRCIDALQNYPKSIDRKVPIEDIPEPPYKETENEDVDTVAKELPKQINSNFHKQLQSLKPEQHKILLLYYGAGFNQTQVAHQLKVNQSLISRRLYAIKINFLKTLVEMSQPREWVADYVVGWLQRNFRAPLHSDLIQVALIEAIKELESKEQEVLRLRYGQWIAEERIASQLGMNSLEVNDMIYQAQQKLQANLIKVLNTWVKEYVEKWLVQFYQAQILAVWGTPNLPLGDEEISKTIDNLVNNGKV